MGLLFMPSEAVRVIKGYPRVYHSSPTSDRAFLPCLWFTSPLSYVTPAHYARLQLAPLDNPHTFTPTMHVCMESAMEWLDIRDDAPALFRKTGGNDTTYGI